MGKRKAELKRTATIVVGVNGGEVTLRVKGVRDDCVLGYLPATALQLANEIITAVAIAYRENSNA